ncbi:MAG: hypothetical protein M3131_04810 [Actinomycetota bacterium]|nr:hypothetical protein [Actinomycetota bacterium]
MRGSTKVTRVLLVADRPVLLAGLQSQLAREGPVGVVGSAAPGCRTFELTTELRPDVALIDAAEGARAFLLCHQLKQLARPQRVVIHVMRSTPRLQVAAWVAGANGLASATTAPPRLSKMIRSAAAGRRSLPRPPIAAVRAAGRRLDPIDVSIFGMRMHDVPSHEISSALRVDPLEVDRRIRSLIEDLSREQEPRPTFGGHASSNGEPVGTRHRPIRALGTSGQVAGQPPRIRARSPSTKDGLPNLRSAPSRSADR